jgi:hypothetical protein
MINLDYSAQVIAERVLASCEARNAEAYDNLSTKTLGVIQENGIYAGILFLNTRSKKEEKQIGEILRSNLLAFARTLIGEPQAQIRTEPQAELGFVSDKLCREIGRMLYVKSSWEQALIYVRYGAKARKSRG